METITQVMPNGFPGTVKVGYTYRIQYIPQEEEIWLLPSVTH